MSSNCFEEFINRFQIIDRENPKLRQEGQRYEIKYYYYPLGKEFICKTLSTCLSHPFADDAGKFKYFKNLEEAQTLWLKHFKQAYRQILRFDEDTLNTYYKENDDGIIKFKNDKIDKLLVLNYDKLFTKLTKYLMNDDDTLKSKIPVHIEKYANPKQPKQQKKNKFIYIKSDDDFLSDDD